MRTITVQPMTRVAGTATQTAKALPCEADSRTLHVYRFDGSADDVSTTSPINLTLDSGATAADGRLPGLG
jgi:hypothetical protein